MRDRGQRQIAEQLDDFAQASAGVEGTTVAEDPGISISDSRMNLNAGIALLKEQLQNTSGAYAGLVAHSSVISADQALERLLVSGTANFTPINDNEVCVTDDSNRWGERFGSVYIGSVEVANYFEREDQNASQAEYYVFSKPVTFHHYDEFIKEAKRLAVSVVDQSTDRELPAELSSQLEQEKEAIVKDGLARCSTILDQATGAIVGTYQKKWFYNYAQDTISLNPPDTETAKVGLFANLANGHSLLHDDQYVKIGNGSGDGTSSAHYIGSQVVADYYYRELNGDEIINYKIFDRAVSQEVYNEFVTGLQGLATNKEHQKLPKDLAKQYTDFRMDQILEQAVKVESGWKDLGSIYGRSYFGSGGGYGSVNAYNLTDWRNHIKTPVEIGIENGDNGFVYGPNRVNIPPDTLIVARGGDAIGRDGRTWKETYYCEPVEASVSPQ